MKKYQQNTDLHAMFCSVSMAETNFDYARSQKNRDFFNAETSQQIRTFSIDENN